MSTFNCEGVAQAEIEIQGPGCTPFGLDNQNLIINSFAQVLSSVSKADLLIRYYTSDSTELPNFGRRRLLLSSSPVSPCVLLL